MTTSTVSRSVDEAGISWPHRLHLAEKLVARVVFLGETPETDSTTRFDESLLRPGHAPRYVIGRNDFIQRRTTAFLDSGESCIDALSMALSSHVEKSYILTLRRVSPASFGVLIRSFATAPF
jgi:hypothetical protein